MTSHSDFHRRIAAYEADRPVPYSPPATPSSHYVLMADGCRIAIDVYLPQGATLGTRFPTLLLFTPYFRRFRLADGSDAMPNPNTGKFSSYFVPRGYAVVVIDVRGTGASFGTRDGFRSPTERRDSAEIADWVIAQSWSNGVLGATGISYLGAASDFLASTGHPAVRAIAPLFSVWDTYADNYFPGGMQCSSLTQIYDTLMKGLDLDRRAHLKDYKYYAHPDYQGPQPVDEDPEGTLVAQAVAEHQANFRQTDFMADFAYREEGLPYDPDYTSASISPYAYAEGIPEDVAILSVSGWMDGAGYANGAIARFLTLDRNPRHLVLGPWDHGARIDVSPWRKDETPDFPVLGCVLRFFDTYLMDHPTGLRDEPPVSYFLMHEQAWAEATSWPPVPAATTLHPTETGTLIPQSASGEARYQCTPDTRTGLETRYERIAGMDSRNYYCDWQGRAGAMLNFDSAPLPQAMRLAGHALLDMTLRFDAPDAGLFVYLTEVETDGTERYITEGVLRALFRAEAPAPEHTRISWPYRTFHRADARPLPQGEPQRIRIPLLPTGWTLSAGSRLRLSIAGADADHFRKVPHGRMPELRIDLAETSLELPMVPA
ncbi:CocE/NonD family hydrolase [Pseudooceanicola sp. CBS1P-1]|uniref:CocE/NonD family hydrolase n=1 Tax=Pseudooceanicola albus TaxID=2692189 RepID=A0A6L7GBC0_9RHOB|nr:MULTISPECIES: CocE/NonD family hydrolase [Pseudooceanicola]MBT9386754.1 CocE/NonD family hydrolase [Pseudooceanicola endophyticus]MXN20982.1 CocE/NonD family hydrolase [Pseudooceanicola albus]